MSGIQQAAAGNEGLFLLAVGTLVCGQSTSGSLVWNGFGASPAIGSYTPISGATVTEAMSFLDDVGTDWDHLHFSAALPGNPATIRFRLDNGNWLTIEGSNGVYTREGSSGTGSPLYGSYFPSSGTYTLTVAFA